MGNKEELEKISEIIKNPVKDIKKVGNTTVLEFDNGMTMPLMGSMFELKGFKVPECNFCGKGADQGLLFSTDDKNYICQDCTILALETFARNGAVIDLNLSKISPKLAERLIADSENNG